MVTAVEPEPPEPSQECTGRLSAILLQYTGPDVAGSVSVVVVAEQFRNDPVFYDFPGGLVTGTVLSSPAENDFTIDATTHGQTDVGSKTRLFINGVEEVLHTSCSVPVIRGAPAPLDSPKGDPSANWFVVDFR